jgi:hypothetical protein
LLSVVFSALPIKVQIFLTGSTGGEIVSVTMAGCDAETDDRCEVSKGDTVTGQLTFKANKAASSLECEIFGIIAGIPLPFPGKKKFKIGQIY